MGRSGRAFWVAMPFALAVALAAPAAAQEITVSWIEGSVGRQVAGGWKAVLLGDSLPLDSTVRLEAKALLECTSAGDRLLLSKPGLYSLKALLGQLRAARQAGADKALGTVLSRLVSKPAWYQEAVGGVRGADQSGGGMEDQWIVEDASTNIKAGKELLEAGKAVEAAAQFETACQAADGETLMDAQFWLAEARSMAGESAKAWRLVSSLTPYEGADWAPDFILLKAKVLVDASSFEEAAAWLQGPGLSLQSDNYRAPSWHFLLGLAYRGAGDGARANQAFSRAAALSPDSDIGKAAAALKGR